MLKRHEILFNQLQTYRSTTLNIIESLTPEEADIIPQGFNNNIRWNLGHIYLDQYLWIQHLTKETIDIPEHFMEWFNYGTSPKGWSTSPPSLETLTELLRNQPNQIKERYASRLEEEFAPTESGMHTIAQVLVRTIYHEAWHQSSMVYLRRSIR